MSRSIMGTTSRGAGAGSVLRRGISLVVAAVLAVAAASSARADYSPVTKATWVPNASVEAVAVSGPYIYLGGQFTALTNKSTGQVVSRTRLARITASTGQLDLTWAPSASDDVLAFAVSEDGAQLFLGGRFLTVSGVARQRLASVSTAGSGALTAGWTASANAVVRAMFVRGGLLYAAGDFTGMNGSTRSRAGAVSESTGVLDPTFRPNISGRTNAAMASLDGSTVLIGGEFTSVGGLPRNYLASVDAVTGAVTGWSPVPGCSTPDPTNPCFVLDLVPAGSAVYTAISGPGGRVVTYDAASGAVRWKVYTDGDVQTVAVDGTKLYAGGHFAPDFGGTTRTMLAAVDLTTGAVDPSFAPVLSTAYPGVLDIASTPTFLVAVGGFTNASGTGQNYFATYPLIDTTPPTAPTGLAALGVTASSATLSWNAATDNVGVTGYQVVRNGSVLPGTVTGLSYTDTALAPSTSYAYTVRAVDAAGNVSADSSAATVTTPAPPDTTAPAAPPTLSVGTVTTTTVDLTWGAASDDVGVTGYQVVRNGSVLPGTVTGLSYTDTGLDPGGTYTYTVRAFDAAGNVSADSPSATVTTPVPPDTTAPTAPPTLSVGTVTASTVGLSWTAASDDVAVTGYQVVRNGTVLPDTVTGLSFTDTGLDPGGTYTYTVRALDAAGNVSPDSSSVVATTPADTTAPSAPATLTSGNVTTSTVDLTWAAASDDVAVTGYQLVRNGTVLPGTLTGLSYTDTGLAPGATYTYTVRALDAAGNVSGDSPSATVTLPWYVDGWSDTTGTPWAPAWTTSQSNGTIDTQGGSGRLLFNDVAGAYARAQLTGSAAQTDSDLLLSYRWSATGSAGYFGVYLRGSGGWQNSYRPKSGYGIELGSGSGSVSVVRNVNGVTTTVQTVSGGQQVTAATQWLRLRVSGSTIQFRTWLDGQAEPTTWKATVIDTSVTTAGQLYLALNRGGTNVGAKSVLLDNLRLAPAP